MNVMPITELIDKVTEICKANGVRVLARVLSIGKVSPPLLLVLEIIFGLIVFGALLAVLARHSTSHRAIIGSLIKK